MSRSSRGFSLIELVVVLMIIGILIAVTGGTWGGTSQPSSVRGTVDTLHGVLSEARTVAQTTGRTVTLTTNGNQANLTLTFPSQGDVVPVPPNQVLTTWLRVAAGADAGKYSGIDMDGAVYAKAAPNPDPFTGGAPAIAALFTNGIPPGPSGQLFKGSANTEMSFDATGRPNRDFYVYVGGLRNGESYPSAPVGLLLVTRANGIHAFYKPNAGDPAVPWQRL